MTRIRGVAEIRRDTISPDTMDAEVNHFSIPALDATGLPERTDSVGIDSHKLLLRGGEVLTSRLNPRKSRVHLVPKDLPRQSVASTEFVVLDPRTIEPRYLRYLLQSEPTRQELDGRTRSATRSHQRVEPIEILNLGVPTDDAGEQRRIADFLDDRVARIDQIIAARQRQIRLASARVHSDIGLVLSGIRDVAPLRRYLHSIQTGGTPPADADTEGGLPWYTPGSFRANFDLGEPTRTVDPSACVRFEQRSVLVVGIGATAGRVAWLEEPATGNQQLTALLPGPELDGRFLLHALNVRQEQVRASAPAATLPILNNDTLRGLELPIPPRATQSVLAADWDALLSSHEALCSALDQQIILLQEYKQSLITAAVTGELDVTTASTKIPE